MMRSAILALLLCGFAVAQVKPDLSGVWIVRGSTDIGASPSYTPDFQRIWQEREKDLK